MTVLDAIIDKRGLKWVGKMPLSLSSPYICGKKTGESWAEWVDEQVKLGNFVKIGGNTDVMPRSDLR